jgi:hypothetical protein
MPTPRRSGLLLAACLAAATLLAAEAAADDAKVGFRGGYYTDLEEPFVGAELLVRVAPRFYFNPNVEYVFVNNNNYFTWNADFHYDFHSRGSSFAWLGAGLAVVTSNPSGPNNTDNDVAANFLAGVGVRSGSLIPYFQAKIIAKDDTEFVLAFGLRF